MAAKPTHSMHKNIDEVHTLLRNIKKPQILAASVWATSCLNTKKLFSDPSLQTSTALQELLSESLEQLKNVNPEYADILFKRFWEQKTVDELIYGIYRGRWSKRNFFNVQKKAIYQLTEILVQQENFCLQQEQQSLLALGIPHKSYKNLVGRSKIVQQLVTVLQPSNHQRVIGIDGMGGIGKTALAIEVTEQCLQTGIFDIVIWINAFRNDNRNAEISLSFESVLDAIGNQLGKASVFTMPLIEKKNLIQTLLTQKNALIVLDNLETAAEYQNIIIRKLHPLLGNSKLLCTSRHRFDDFEVSIFNVNLTGLPSDSAIAFLRQEGEEKGIGRIKNAPVDALREIAVSTGGSPLAMKLVSGQLLRLPLEVILDTLKHIPSLNTKMNENEYLRFYKHIFQTSVKLLSTNSESVLIAMSHFPPGEGKGGTFSMIQATVEPLKIRRNELTNAINELWQLSLLEIDRASTLRDVRYYLHVLTQYMVHADMLHLLK